MRKLLFLLLLLPLALMSQSKFGYFSYSTVLDTMPQYRSAMEDYAKLKKRCLKEIEHNEQELTRYYVAFLDGHRDFPEPILRKRQKELQQMIDNSVIFRDNLKVWLRHAKDSLSAASRQVVDSALHVVCMQNSLLYAIDIDHREYKYVNPLFGQDITTDLISAILYPELWSGKVVECADKIDGTCSVNEMPATEIIPDKAVEVVPDSLFIPATERIPDKVLTVSHKELQDSISNR